MRNVVNMSEYEQAVTRFNDANDNLARIRREIIRLEDREDEAETEYGAARANLRRFEVSPGVPKPEYR